jgi:hypothetical protein
VTVIFVLIISTKKQVELMIIEGLTPLDRSQYPNQFIILCCRLQNVRLQKLGREGGGTKEQWN